MPNPFVSKLVREMKAVFGGDQKRIDHALDVLGFAEQILSAEGGDAEVILAAAVLHDIGIQEAERKYGSSAGVYQELEGPPIAEEILRRQGVSEDRLEHVCKIVGNHHSAKSIDTAEFRAIWDADWLVNFLDVFPPGSGGDRMGSINRIFKTETGRQIALHLFAASQH